MDRAEAIDARSSVRTYTMEAIDDPTKKQIMETIEGFNIDPEINIEWMDDGSKAFGSRTKTYGLFKNVRSLIALKGNPGDPDLIEKLGYYGELLVLDATAAGLGTCFVAGTYDKDAIGIRDGEELACVITIGHPAEKKRFREKLVKKMTAAKVDIKDHLTSDTECPEWLLDGVNAALKAPSAMNRKPVRFRYADGMLTASVEKSDVYSLLDLGIAKANFVTMAKGHFEFGNDSPFVKE